MRKTFTVLLLLCAAFAGAAAQGFEADSLGIETEAPPINDYMLIGVNYGVSFATMYYMPARHNRAFVISPNYVSEHEKMFTERGVKTKFLIAVKGPLETPPDLTKRK